LIGVPNCRGHANIFTKLTMYRWKGIPEKLFTNCSHSWQMDATDCNIQAQV